MIFGGFVTERTLRVICDEPDDPNMLLYCDDRDNDIPFRPQLKLSGTYPLPWGIQVSAAFQSLAGRPLGGFTTTRYVQQDQRSWLRRHRQPGRDEVAAHADHAISGELPGAMSGRRAGDSDADRGLGHRAAGRAGHRVPAAAQPARSELRQAGSRSAGCALQGQVDIFNVFNENTDLATARPTSTTPAYLQPSSVLQGRIIRIGTRINW